MLASQSGQEDFVRLLLSNKADAEAKDEVHLTLRYIPFADYIVYKTVM